MSVLFVCPYSNGNFTESVFFSSLSPVIWSVEWVFWSMAPSSLPRWSLKMLGSTLAAPVIALAGPPLHQHTWQCNVSCTIHAAYTHPSSVVIYIYIQSQANLCVVIYLELTKLQVVTYKWYDMVIGVWLHWSCTHDWYLYNLPNNLSYFYSPIHKEPKFSLSTDSIRKSTWRRKVENKCNGKMIDQKSLCTLRK